MKSIPSIFKQVKHDSALDEVFHAFNLPNIANVLFWSGVFEELVRSKAQFESIVECGVGRGRSLITLTALASYYKSFGKFKGALHVYGLDSFKGFPEPSPEDNSERKPQKGEWSQSPSGKYQYTPDFLRHVLQKANIVLDDVKLVEGYFETTTYELALTNPRIGILHCDGDLYQSVKVPLANLHEHIVPGGIIVFDDFIEKDDPEDDAFPGARLAYTEFINAFGHNYNKLPSPRGNVVLQKVKTPIDLLS